MNSITLSARRFLPSPQRILLRQRFSELRMWLQALKIVAIAELLRLTACRHGLR